MHYALPGILPLIIIIINNNNNDNKLVISFSYFNVPSDEVAAADGVDDDDIIFLVHSTSFFSVQFLQIKVLVHSTLFIFLSSSCKLRSGVL